ncbi:MAG: hypothetical protein JGK24_06090 [Microcoleus sp. PH2017_29_MFU_D_A]|nr:MULTISPECIES: hypothetical protein [unclassified Microcoleus]MCC3413610.1 hypothetical protein [Microcoleus sp. PH2017_02_FOX_O_A]MCC3435505.1 hypothetical protein [Microcoleus sp. PH2017_05_CCC_O_A]MCC3446773.1 hypothetical protein [Microcoleus sp. PH2017_09_SFU_O_A]MCC3470833.1 hypothetical protein [Microcoleus sp. PH2017_13_LAR_U_A]MCC3483353.1 hypothetical protein [Microcoleus sp. PH2017_14_LAR_D_A]
MNSLILISPYKGSGFQPILSGKSKKQKARSKEKFNKLERRRQSAARS